MHFGNILHELVYRRNPHYLLAYLTYPLIYLGFFAFIYLILNIQKRSIDKRIATEKKMAELQMAMLRNQLDPHFVLNAINSIIYLVHTSEIEKAEDGLRSFSALYRDLVLTGNETRRSLAEEIEFCRSYLTLEKIRYGDRLNYGIYITPGTELDMPVPKMILQLYVENAIKHGISKLEKGGHIDIIVSGNNSGYCIAITDNGAGRDKKGDSESLSTGKGMKLMQELFDVYNRYYKEKISVEIIDLFERKEPVGTKVIITIAESR
jgi:sensor histidine kinase YesM